MKTIGKCRPLLSFREESSSAHRLLLNTANTTVGTNVILSCSKPGLVHNGSVVLTCGAEQKWNGSIADCFLNAHERSNNLLTSNTSDFTLEVIVIWSAGGVMILLLVAVIAALVCARHRLMTASRTRFGRRGQDLNGVQNRAFVSIHDVDGFHRFPNPRARDANARAPPYPGSPRLASTSGDSSSHRVPPPPYPGQQQNCRILPTNNPSHSTQTVAPNSSQRHQQPMPLPVSTTSLASSSHAILEPPPPYSFYPSNRNVGRTHQERRSFSARLTRAPESTLYI